eukprot:GGOE01055034.1.p1 GENE.GGOE01055034.1~~GGOE01055034.1.p1  ORF type:complete len:161 (-),score=2.58 GGOE01055034.1:102-584(-)
MSPAFSFPLYAEHSVDMLSPLMGAAIMVRVLNTGLSLYPPPFYVPEYYFHDLLAPPSPMFCSFGTSRSPRSTDNAAHTRDADTQTDSLLVCSGGVYRARPFHPPPTAYSSLTVGDCLPAQYPHRYFNGRHAPTARCHIRGGPYSLAEWPQPSLPNPTPSP